MTSYASLLHIYGGDKLKLMAREAEQKAAHWLHLGNLASERGDTVLAERHYDKSQKHHDAMNHYLGNGSA